MIWFDQIFHFSWGKSCAKPQWPGVYARLSSAIDWIYTNTQDSTFCDKPSRRPRRRNDKMMKFNKLWSHNVVFNQVSYYSVESSEKEYVENYHLLDKIIYLCISNMKKKRILSHISPLISKLQYHTNLTLGNRNSTKWKGIVPSII